MTLQELQQKLKDYQYITDTENALVAVSKDGYALQYVQNQTPEICLAAVNENGYALQYVQNQTPEICLAAVNQNGDALQYVDKAIFKDLVIDMTLAEVSALLNQNIRIIK